MSFDERAGAVAAAGSGALFGGPFGIFFIIILIIILLPLLGFGGFGGGCGGFAHE
ncbi:UNVERIFIED_CONTAM: hypothetical protein Cloal_2760 [Acetivibrio alkalicellulosi]